MVRASDRHAADSGSIPRCGKGFFSQSQLSVQTLLRCPYISVCNRMHCYLCACERSCSSCQSSEDYGNAKTSSMHRRLCSANLLQLAFPSPWGRQPEFPMGKSHWDNSCKHFFFNHTIVLHGKNTTKYYSLMYTQSLCIHHTVHVHTLMSHNETEHTAVCTAAQ